MPKKRVIAVASVGRSDWGLYESIIKEAKAFPSLTLRLMPTAAHFAPRFGSTSAEFEQHGVPYERGLEMLLDTITPQGIAKSVGLGIISFAQAFASSTPDILLILGDRTEMLCAPLAAIPFNIPVAHIHGGKVTEGATDELVRHALTKLSHIHFASCAEYAARIRQMGEESWRVHNVGAPGLDRLRYHKRTSKSDLFRQLDLDPSVPFLLATYQPVTLEARRPCRQIESLLEALDQSRCQIVLTYPNADLGNSPIIERFTRFAEERHRNVRLIKNAGSCLYLDMMAWASAMVGNSSSGIVEAPSFALPVVNIGTRQAGAVRAANVIDVDYSTEGIAKGIRKALSKDFRQSLRGLKNPYGDGRAGRRILKVLHSVPIDDRLRRKRFIDLEPSPVSQ